VENEGIWMDFGIIQATNIWILDYFRMNMVNAWGFHEEWRLKAIDTWIFCDMGNFWIKHGGFMSKDGDFIHQTRFVSECEEETSW
jgi:hypothetical protein